MIETVEVYKYLELLETSIESNFYCVVESFLDSSKLFELYKQGSIWKVRKYLDNNTDEKTWKTYKDHTSLVNDLVFLNINLDKVVYMIKNFLLNEAIFCELRFKKLKNVLGKDHIKEGINSYENFKKQLLSVVKKVTNQSDEKPKLTLIKNEDL